ncbi:hypothetical protein DWG18_08105 [Lysobacter sp. TY2-98]|uniref:hypothetical protein n=1 Tax=Lysobacter sp. TY2-98 TaxID=2290922 RepID=UPI000E20A94C|nr:hypothetical protein [Lysobacter sp. TY2-98]AXK72247.1 hypothetical protein DWG18_08105 [Lysobacter sp. TY2-98]
MTSPLLSTVLLGAGVALLGFAPLLPALRELRRGVGRPLHIPGDDDAGAGFFAARMRERLREEFGDGDPLTKNPLPSGWIAASNTPIEGAHGRADEPAATLIGQRVALAPGCRYLGDVVAREYADLGHDAVVRAVLVEAGDTRIADRATVLRWIDAGFIDAGRDARLLGRTTARERVVLGTGAEFRRIAAPTITFGRELASVAPVDIRDARLDEVTDGDFIEHPDEQGRWVCRGALRIPRGTRVRGHLVVEGALHIEDDCEILGSVKAHRGARVGDRVHIDGSVFAGPHAVLGEHVTVHGMLSAEATIDCGRGLRVGRLERPASLLAPVIRVGDGGCVHGAAWASRLGKVVE